MNSLPDHRSNPVMGFPPLNGYPRGQGRVPPPPQPAAYPLPYRGRAGYASPYHGYANPPHTANLKDYPPQSFNMWYTSNKHGQWMPEPSNSQKFARLMFATMITLLISLCMVSLVVWLLFGTHVPDFQLASFTVSNLTISGSVIEANWAVNMTVTNPNSDSKANAGPGVIQASILYKDYPLAISKVHPTYRRAKVHGQTRVNLYFTMDHEKSICNEDLATEITMAQKAGNLIVSLRLSSPSKFSPDDKWKRDSLRIFCEELNLSMTPQGMGELSEDSTRGCLIFS